MSLSGKSSCILCRKAFKQQGPCLSAEQKYSRGLERSGLASRPSPKCTGLFKVPCPFRSVSQELSRGGMRKVTNQSRDPETPNSIERFSKCKRRELLQTAALLLLLESLEGRAAAQTLATDSRHMDNDFATSLMKTTYDELAATGKIPEAEIQKQFFRLRQQEYPYFKDASQGSMSPIQKPGDLSEVPYFNFVSYIQWKVVAKHLRTTEERMEFNRKVGRSLLRRLESSQAQRESSDMKKDVESILKQLQTAGYVEGFSVEWRKDGGDSTADEPDVRIQLRQPAVLQGAQLLRAEADGFWQKFSSSILQALFEERGYAAEVDEYFFQEHWQPPKSWAGRLLLALGDPLQKVDVPFDPDILIQNWQLRRRIVTEQANCLDNNVGCLHMMASPLSIPYLVPMRPPIV